MDMDGYSNLNWTLLSNIQLKVKLIVQTLWRKAIKSIITDWNAMTKTAYLKTSSISHTKYQNLNVSCLVIVFAQSIETDRQCFNYISVSKKFIAY